MKVVRLEEEKKMLEGALSLGEEEASKAKATIIQLKKTGQKSREERQEAEMKVARLEEEKKTLEEALGEARSPNQGNDETHKLLKESVDRISTLVTEKKRLKAENEELLKTSKQVAQLQEELSQERKILWGSKMVSEVRREAKDAEERVEKLRNMLKESTVELDKMKSINQVMKVQVKLLTDKLSVKSSAEKENRELHVQNSKLLDEKKALEAENIALQEKVRKEEVKNAENALDLNLEKERLALEMVTKREEIVKMGEMLSNNRCLLKEMKVNCEKMLHTTLASMEVKLKDYDKKVSELKAEKGALEKELERSGQLMGKGIDADELQKLRSHRLELTKMGERLTAAQEQSAAERVTIENQLKVIMEQAAETEKKRKILEQKLAEEKERHRADLKILKEENFALKASRERESALAQVQLSEAQNWQDKFEESLRRRERRTSVGTEDIEDFLEQGCVNMEQSSLVMDGKKATVVETLVGQQQIDERQLETDRMQREVQSDSCENRYPMLNLLFLANFIKNHLLRKNSNLSYRLL